jgi:hypothetical protein
MSVGLKTAVQAIGKIKLYQFLVGTVILLVLPISFFALSMGYPPYTVLVCSLLMELIALSIRLKIVNYIAGLSIVSFYRNVIVKVLIIGMTSFLFTYYVKQYLTEGIFRIFVIFFVSTLTSITLIWFYGLVKNEREIISQMFKKIIVKVCF